eukprot:3196227-Pyramimonas_sp.AAC.1
MDPAPLRCVRITRPICSKGTYKVKQKSNKHPQQKDQDEPSTMSHLVLWCYTSADRRAGKEEGHTQKAALVLRSIVDDKGNRVDRNGCHMKKL